MSYRTPKGKDESELPLPDYLKKYEGRITLHKYRNGKVLRGGPYSTKILDELGDRINNNKGLAINITGPPGIGKTYFGMAFAQLYDDKFGICDTPSPEPSKDPSNICFEREHITYLVGDNSPLKRGQAILIDEAHFGMGSRSFQNKNQIDIVNLIAAIRSKGFVLIIVSLHSSMLDKIPREFVINYEFSVNARGNARVYYRWFPTFATQAYNKYKGDLKMPLPDSYDPETKTGCNNPDCLRCQYLYGKQRCHNLRARYERRKKEFIGKMSKNQEDTSYTKMSVDERFELLNNNWELLEPNRDGNISIESIMLIFENAKQPSGKNTAYFYQKQFFKRYPERIKLFKNKK